MKRDIISIQELEVHFRVGVPDEERKAPQRLTLTLRLEGNFLFDRAEPDDMRQALMQLDVSADSIGDLWLRGDRGAQAVCTPEAGEQLNGLTGQVRDVPLLLETVPLDALQWPARRTPRLLRSVEASCRLDAIASAGFGLSRSKVTREIKEGRLRLNWGAIRQASRDVKVGDQLQLQDRGSVEVLSLTLTKRERWRVEMMRR